MRIAIVDPIADPDGISTTMLEWGLEATQLDPASCFHRIGAVLLVV